MCFYIYIFVSINAHWLLLDFLGLYIYNWVQDRGHIGFCKKSVAHLVKNNHVIFNVNAQNMYEIHDTD